MKSGRLRRLLGRVSVVLLLLCLLSGVWIAALADDPSAVVTYKIAKIVAVSSLSPLRPARLAD